MDKLIGTLAVIYVGAVVGASAVTGATVLNKTCDKVNCNGTEIVGQNYQKFLQRLESQYRYL